MRDRSTSGRELAPVGRGEGAVVSTCMPREHAVARLHLEDGRYVVEHRHRRGEQYGACTTGQAGGDVQFEGRASKWLTADAHAESKDPLDRQMVLNDVRAARGPRRTLGPRIAHVSHFRLCPPLLGKPRTQPVDMGL